MLQGEAFFFERDGGKGGKYDGRGRGTNPEATNQKEPCLREQEGGGLRTLGQKNV